MAMSNGMQEILLFVLLGLIACCSIYLIIFYLKIYYKVISKTKKWKNNGEENERGSLNESPGISVIIAANNQEAELRRNLEKILNQKYSKFEVIVVLDSEADDSSEDLLTAFMEKYPNLYQTYIPKGSKYLNRHKLMLSIGIKASHHKWLLFTDADCQPGSDQWIQLMANKMTADKSAVIGTVVLQPRSEDYPISLWKKIQKTFIDQMLNALGMALNGKPYRASGKNMAYRKSLFNENKGFSRQLTFEGGEDSLLINDIATGKNTAVVLNKKAWMFAETYCTKKSWKNKCKIEKKMAAKLTGSAAHLIGIKRLASYLLAILVIVALTLSFIIQDWMVLTLVTSLWIIPMGILFIIKRMSRNMYYL